MIKIYEPHLWNSWANSKERKYGWLIIFFECKNCVREEFAKQFRWNSFFFLRKINYWLMLKYNNWSISAEKFQCLICFEFFFLDWFNFFVKLSYKNCSSVYLDSFQILVTLTLLIFVSKMKWKFDQVYRRTFSFLII